MRYWLGLTMVLLGGGFLCGCGGGNALYDADFQKVVRQAGDQVFPSVVYIKAIRSDLERGKNEANEVSGSGVLVSSDGEVLTNWHVVDKAQEMRCLLYDGSHYNATLIGGDKELDIALLKLDRPADAPALPTAILAENFIKEGDFVMAMGAPWGLARSVSIGIISCSNRYLPGNGNYTLWYQTDAAISPGNSGGPLINIDGEVVGINTLGMLIGGAVGFTIPSPIIREVIDRIREYGKVNWAWFGLDLQPLNDFDRNIYFDFKAGVVVSGTEPGSPARRAGFLSHDCIIAYNGIPISAVNQEDLPRVRRMLGLLPFDVPVKFTLLRGGEKMEISVAPIAKEKVEGEEIAFPRWGFSAKAINRFDNPNLHFYAPHGGVFVYGVDFLGNASSSQLVRQDIILTVDGKPVKTLDELREIYDAALKNIDTKTRIVIGVLRNGQPKQLVLNYLNNYDKE